MKAPKRRWIPLDRFIMIPVVGYSAYIAQMADIRWLWIFVGVLYWEISSLRNRVEYLE